MKENGQLKDRMGKLEKDYSDLKDRVERSEEQGGRIDVREAMRSLENYIVVELVGSKRQAKMQSLFTVKDLQQSKYADKIPLSPLECQWLDYFKSMIPILL